MNKEITVKQFLLKKFPTNEYIDCPIPKEYWPIMQEYAEAYHKSASDPSTEQSTSNWQAVGDKDKFLDEGGKESDVLKILKQGKVSHISAEEVSQKIKELSTYIDDIYNYYTINKGKDAGNLWIQFSDKFITLQKRLANASIVNERKDNVGSDAIQFADWFRHSKYGVNSMGDWINYDTYEKSTTEELYKIFQESQPQQKEESEKELEERTDRNMNVISDFVEHLESENIVIPESVILSFFNA